MDRVKLSSLNRGLLITAILVISLASAATWVGFRATDDVSAQTTTLVAKQIPQLRSISGLQDQINRHVLGLYLYYATLDATHWDSGKALAKNISIQLAELSALISPVTQRELDNANQSLNQHIALFHEEMSRGRDRNWDTLREHLANAQTQADQVDTILVQLASSTREAVREGSAATTSKVTQLTTAQIAFSLVMLTVVLVALAILRARAKDQAELYQRAYFDILTGLPNRRYFEEHWSQNTTAPYQTLMIVKLERYQLFIGTYGQKIVDQIITLVADRLQKVIDLQRMPATLYQLAPATWLINMQDDEDRNSSTLVAEMIIRMSSKPLNVADRDFIVTECIGITHFPDHASTAEALLQNAETAVRTSQQRGKPCTVFSDEMRTSSEQFLATENAMRQGLHNGEFELHYQPKTQAGSLECVGSEALVRWRHQGELVSPGSFIPIAEESGFIIDLGRWVLDEACRQWQSWRNTGFPELPVAVNVSALQFQTPGFVDQVAETMKRHSIPPGMLELEITEEATFGDPQSIIDTLEALLETGVTLAIDDFGTGYSSLAYLKKFPVQVLKIDQAFIRDMTSSARDLSIVNMMVMLGRKFDFKVVAEGVETEYQQEHLRNIGCDLLQGYLYSKPLPAADFETYIRQAGSEVA